jgi:hypothetical protein
MVTVTVNHYNAEVGSVIDIGGSDGGTVSGRGQNHWALIALFIESA